MRNGLCSLVIMMVLGALPLCGSAHATFQHSWSHCPPDNPECTVDFTVSDIGFSSLNGATERFKWSVTPVSGDLAFSLNDGEALTFTYGAFSTSDFPFGSADKADNDDSFQANFLLTPPVPGARVSASGEPDATALIAWCLQLDYAVVDFNNNWRDYTFGDGGLFRLMFLDLGPIVHDGSYDLRARIKLIDCPEEGDGGGGGGPTPVPEPATVVLLGSGLLGLCYMGRRKRKS